MPSYPTWDFLTARPADLSLSCGGASFGGGRSVLSGISYSLDYSAGGEWTVQYGRVQLFTPASHLAWNAAAARMNGSVLPMNIIIPVGYINPFPGGAPRELPTIDGPAVIKAQMGDGAALYASTISIRILEGDTLKAGHLFSINHSTLGWRLYTVTEIDMTTDSPTTDTDAILYTVGIRPPLREAVAQGTTLEMDWPRCAMKLPEGQDMAWSPANYWRSQPSVTFIEYF